jgi:hypothetical protein
MLKRKRSIFFITQRWPIFFLLLQWIVFSQYGYSNQSIGFNQNVFLLEGEVTDVILKDLNGDSAVDMMVVHNRSQFPDPNIDRIISVFFQKEDHFSDQPDQIILADNDEIIFDIGDLDGDRFPDLAFLKSNGVYIRKNTTTGFLEQLTLFKEIPSAFIMHDPSQIKRYPFIRDLDGDSIPEMLIPKVDQLSIFSKEISGQYLEKTQLWVAPELSLSAGQDPLTFSVQFPFFHLHDFNGDRIHDFLIQSGDRVDVYFQHPMEETGRVNSIVPPDLRYRMVARNINPSVINPMTDPSISIELVDLNQDGYVDLLLTRASRANFTTHISQIQIYINRYGRFDQVPNQVIPAENFGGEHVIKDFNHDGLLDIGILDFRIGFSQAIKFLLTKKANNDYLFYLMGPDGTYSKSPDKKISFSRKVNLNDIFGSEICQSFEGDFNGDGLADFLVSTDTDELSIYLGLENDLFTEKAQYKIETAPSTHFRIEDVNRDHFSDIVFWYPDNPDISNQVVLIQCRPQD